MDKITDKQRLDWLILFHPMIIDTDNGRFHLFLNGVRYVGKSARQAIDDAMLRSKAPREGRDK